MENRYIKYEKVKSTFIIEINSQTERILAKECDKWPHRK